MNYDQAVEEYTDRQIEHLFSTRPNYITCPICESSYKEDSSIWITPHPCAEEMQSSQAFVCSGACREAWKEEFWEEIEEYNYVQQFNTQG